MGLGKNITDQLGDLFYPTDRDVVIKTSMRWLKAKAVDDDCGGLWRIHDDLYDFEKFIKIHPGGADWLSLTKGTDITEAVESMHALGIPKKLLAKYRVRRATTTRKYRSVAMNHCHGGI